MEWLSWPYGGGDGDCNNDNGTREKKGIRCVGGDCMTDSKIVVVVVVTENNNDDNGRLVIKSLLYNNNHEHHHHNYHHHKHNIYTKTL